MVFILIWFWGKNYLKKSSNLAFLSNFSDFDVFRLNFSPRKLLQNIFFRDKCIYIDQIKALVKFLRFEISFCVFFEGFIICKIIVLLLEPKELGT